MGGLAAWSNGRPEGVRLDVADVIVSAVLVVHHKLPRMACTKALRILACLPASRAANFPALLLVAGGRLLGALINATGIAQYRSSVGGGWVPQWMAGFMAPSKYSALQDEGRETQRWIPRFAVRLNYVERRSANTLSQSPTQTTRH